MPAGGRYTATVSANGKTPTMQMQSFMQVIAFMAGQHRSLTGDFAELCAALS